MTPSVKKKVPKYSMTGVKEYKHMSLIVFVCSLRIARLYAFQLMNGTSNKLLKIQNSYN